MSAENVDVVRRVYEAVARRDTAGVLALYDRDVEWDMSRHPHGTRMGREVYRGHDALRRWFRQYYEAWQDVDFAPEELIDAGEHVIVVAEGRAAVGEVGLTSSGHLQASGHFGTARSLASFGSRLGMRR